jgi:hypothetical protein
MDGASASMNPKMLGAAMQLIGNKKGQSMLPALGQAAMSVRQPWGGFNIPPANNVPGMNGQGSGIATQQMIPQFSGGAGQFLSGPASLMGGYQSQMWNQQRVNPQLNFQAPLLNAMPSLPQQQPRMMPPVNPWPYTPETDPNNRY